MSDKRRQAEAKRAAPPKLNYWNLDNLAEEKERKEKEEAAKEQERVKQEVPVREW